MADLQTQVQAQLQLLQRHPYVVSVWRWTLEHTKHFREPLFWKKTRLALSRLFLKHYPLFALWQFCAVGFWLQIRILGRRLQCLEKLSPLDVRDLTESDVGSLVAVEGALHSLQPVAAATNERLRCIVSDVRVSVLSQHVRAGYTREREVSKHTRTAESVLLSSCLDQPATPPSSSGGILGIAIGVGQQRSSNQGPTIRIKGISRAEGLPFDTVSTIVKPCDISVASMLSLMLFNYVKIADKQVEKVVPVGCPVTVIGRLQSDGPLAPSQRQRAQRQQTPQVQGSHPQGLQGAGPSRSGGWSSGGGNSSETSVVTQQCYSSSSSASSSSSSSSSVSLETGRKGERGRPHLDKDSRVCLERDRSSGLFWVTGMGLADVVGRVLWQRRMWQFGAVLLWSLGAGVLFSALRVEFLRIADDDPSLNAAPSHFQADLEVPEGGEQEDCIVCLSQRRQVILVPCGHVALCRGCAARLNSCPLCHTEVGQRIEIRGVYRA